MAMTRNEDVVTLNHAPEEIGEDGIYIQDGRRYKKVDEYTHGDKARASGLKFFMQSRKGVIGFEDITPEQAND